MIGPESYFFLLLAYIQQWIENGDNDDDDDDDGDEIHATLLERGMTLRENIRENTELGYKIYYAGHEPISKHYSDIKINFTFVIKAFL